MQPEWQQCVCQDLSKCFGSVSIFFSLRNGHRDIYFASELVPGDIVDLDVGDRVPADLRLFEVNLLNICYSCAYESELNWLTIRRMAQPNFTKLKACEI